MNYTNVKRVGEYFSITNKQESQRLDIELCTKCAALKTCSTRRKLKNQKAIIAPVKRCNIFKPYIGFSALDGLDAEEYNTVRVYSAWANRLREGDTVTIYDSLNDQVIEDRRVSRVYSGPKQEMLDEHAKFNHACLSIESDHPQFLKELLIRSMGKNFFNASDTASVIYLQRI